LAAERNVHFSMIWPCETITDFDAGRERIRTRRYGVIETSGSSLTAVYLRPLPKLLALPDLVPLDPRYHASGEDDRCRLYYNQPRRMPNFLALKYIVSTSGTSYATFRAALQVLDAIAAVKRSDAIVCDALNVRLSDRLMQRLGWEPHKPQRWHRNFIRRFYGVYPPSALGAWDRTPASSQSSVSTAGGSAERRPQPPLTSPPAVLAE